MSFTQRYTAHLGYAPPALRPQFSETVGSTDPVDLIAHAARIGMAGVFDPWATRREEREIAEMAAALSDTGLSCSSIVSVPLEYISAPLWTDRSPAGRSALEGHVRAAATTARTLSSSQLAVLVAADPDRSADRQVADAAANLREMSILAADFGAELAIEPMVALPNMLLRNITDAVDIVKAADTTGVGIIFDTAHVSVTDGDLMTALNAARGHITSLQVVDMPGRIEPGAGHLPIVELLTAALTSGYTGLIDLEHYWLESTPAGEQTGLERLRQFDAHVADAVRSTTNTPTPLTEHI
ncbi:sugar phosphate isomerase/epimerase family protein [Rhodococcus sp. NPDC057297]|uniref:sugar phosphate isomerase/epimerase family protein n=1 Tax=Rhodococcus sp. NPDC057297 TaxID=3346090 RepID=UPI003634291E